MNRRALLVMLCLACAGSRDLRNDRDPWHTLPDPGVQYFPLATADASRDAELFRWYAKALDAMGEPSLAVGAHGGEVRRFLWLRSYHRPVAVRLVTSDSTCRVVLTMLNGTGRTTPGTIERRDSSVTDRGRCHEVDADLMRAGFASASAVTADRETDGAEWVFESNGRAGYRVVARWSPVLVPRDRPFAVAGRSFLRLAAWDEAPDDRIY
jgi:hypothetical protein